MIFFAWGAWFVTIVVGIIFVMLREAPEGYSSVSLPRIFFFIWMMLCVVILLAMRLLPQAILTLAASAVLGFFAFLPSQGSINRKKELDERLIGAKRTLEEEPNNSMSHELLGDLYSTLEDRALAFEHWRKSLELRPDANIREKVAALERIPPVFYTWGQPAARDWRACPGCRSIQPRLAEACPTCAHPFFGGKFEWILANVDRICEESGAESLLKVAVYLLPFLYFLGPKAYACACLSWALAFRRPSDPSDEPPAKRLAGLGSWFAVIALGAWVSARAPQTTRNTADSHRIAHGSQISADFNHRAEAMLREAQSGALGPETMKLLQEGMAKAEADGSLDRPLDDSGVTPRQLREEAAKGIAGPAVNAYLDSAARHGLLDLPIMAMPGMTYRQALEKARELSAKAEALAAESAARNAEQGFGAERPEDVIPVAIRQLNSSNTEERLEGAQTLCDVRFARHPMAVSARGELERAAASPNQDLAGFASLALRRLEFFDAKRRAVRN